MLRDHIRRYLGTQTIPNHLADLEERMTTMLELLNGLVTKTTEASAAQQASFLNLHNAVGKLTTNVARLEQLVRDGETSEELQAVAAQIRTNLDDMKRAADTADDGFEPVEAPTDPGAPVAEVPAEQPVVETPTDTVPVDETPTEEVQPQSRKR